MVGEFSHSLTVFAHLVALFYSFSPLYSLEKMTDLVAVWDVALSDGIHKIEFEHGTTSGKRVVYVDGKVGKHVTLYSMTVKLGFVSVAS